MRRARGRRTLAITAALAMLVGACGDDDDGGSAATTSAAETTTTAGDGTTTTAGGDTTTTAAAVDCDFEGDEIKVGTQVATGPLVGEQFLDFVPGVRARLEMENAA